MNELVTKYGSKGLSVIGFPCNQFGHQENCNGEETLLCLKHVRPGGGYEPNFTMTSKIEVNGANAHPLFKFLKSELPLPSDDPVSFMGNNNFIIWNPVERTDIAWNFEKFLINAEGKPVKRFSKKFEMKDMTEDIEALLKEIN